MPLPAAHLAAPRAQCLGTYPTWRASACPAVADQENQDAGDAAPTGASLKNPTYLSGSLSAFAAGIFGGAFPDTACPAATDTHCLTTISSPCGLIPCCASTGLLLAPQTWAPANVQGVNYVPSIAAGVLISAPIVNGALLAAGREPLALKPQAAALPGICAGVAWWARVPATLLSALYTGLCESMCLAFVCAESAEVELNRCDECRNAGNILSILAVNNPNVGYAIAYPIYQVRSSVFFNFQSTLACSQPACTNKTITTWEAVNPPCTCTWPPWPKCQHLSQHMKVL